MAEELICVLRVAMVSLLFSLDAPCSWRNKHKPTDPKRESLLSKVWAEAGAPWSRSENCKKCEIPVLCHSWVSHPSCIACSVSAAIWHLGFIEFCRSLINPKHPHHLHSDFSLALSFSEKWISQFIGVMSLGSRKECLWCFINFMWSPLIFWHNFPQAIQAHGGRKTSVLESPSVS